MSISPINDSRLQLDTPKLDSAETGIAQDVSQPAIADQKTLTDQEVLALSVWPDDSRTLGLEAMRAEAAHGMPPPEELDRIAADILSFVT